MNKAVGGILIAAAIVGIFRHVTAPVPAPGKESIAKPPRPVPQLAVEREDFRCDGRQYCRQMTSCAEARYFLEHCPGVKMDGEKDGIPCEDQWCGLQ